MFLGFEFAIGPIQAVNVLADLACMARGGKHIKFTTNLNQILFMGSKDEYATLITVPVDWTA